MGFTKDELKRILPAMIIKLRELIKNPGELEQAGTDEEKICRIIENKQREVFSDLNIDGDQGMQNLRTVGKEFRADMEIMRPFTAMVQVEELIVTLIVAKNGGKQPTPAEMQQLVQNIQTLSAPVSAASMQTHLPEARKAVAAAYKEHEEKKSSGAASSSADASKPSQNAMEK
eukprot:TRINITY_DN3321_c0_g1_i1.p1 TRINITY_DN3321_c0_g1~~TRINITY_DN3321_c0_g1_i1.p1  ORF type:complete len:187 (-),score=44.60 TRINITY_DN3321_c0_g1_i1:31-549(-)